MMLIPGQVFAYVVLLHTTGKVFGDCDTAPLVAGAFHNGSVTGPYSEGVVLRYLCSLAYDRVLGGSNYYSCSSEVWTGGNLTCTLGRCTYVEPEPNSYIVGQAGHYVGETTTFSCYGGYEMNGDDLITCMADRRWSPEPPTCVKVRCPEFSTPDAQIFQDFSGVRNEFGSKNKITCTGGTVLQGPQYITCLANKTWSGSPSCTVPNCGNPPASYEPCTDVFYTDDNTNIGSQVEVICHENAVPSGTSPYLICSSTGRWSHEYHCLCGCRHDCNGSVNTGPRNVTHGSEIDCPCPDGSHFKRKCLNGTLETKTSCSSTHPTTTLPVTHPTTTLPVTHNRTTLPVTHNRTTLPVTHNRTKLPVTYNRTTLTVTLIRTTPTLTHRRTPSTQHVSNVLIAIIVTCVLACTIVIAASLGFLCCPCCKTRRKKLHTRCKLCFQDENSKDNIPPDTVKMTAMPLVAEVIN
ncbi:hypothetical protein ACJMK2_036544 [Sinanodonta woodiana]|uniref:Sushi domain-containing protein n=1 Tax=Sinanodonta woodiana TaxID=1069815 RepID=A0ABD3WHI8_SINWO